MLKDFYVSQCSKTPVLKNTDHIIAAEPWFPASSLYIFPAISGYYYHTVIFLFHALFQDRTSIINHKSGIS